MTARSLGERFVGHGVAFATRGWVRNILEGGSVNPAITPVEFHVARTTAQELAGLALFHADTLVDRRDRGSWPVAAMKLKSSKFNEALGQPENAGGKRAVAWRLGQSVMLVGSIPLEDAEVWANANPTIGMRVGPKNLMTAPVIWRPDDTLVIPEGGFETVEAIGPGPSSYYKNASVAKAADNVLVY